jgi:hypothetical protein
VPSSEPFLLLSWVFARELEIALDEPLCRVLPIPSPDGRCIALLRVEEKSMEPFETVLLDMLLEGLRSLSEDELRLVVTYCALADPRLVEDAVVWSRRVADSVSEAPGG